MQPKADMVPKECGFNPSETAGLPKHAQSMTFSRLACNGKGWLYKRSIFFHHADTICYPNYIKRWNLDVTIIRSFRTTYFHVSYHQHMYPGSAEALVTLRKSQDGDTDEFIIFRV